MNDNAPSGRTVQLPRVALSIVARLAACVARGDCTRAEALRALEEFILDRDDREELFDAMLVRVRRHAEEERRTVPAHVLRWSAAGALGGDCTEEDAIGAAVDACPEADPFVVETAMRAYLQRRRCGREREADALAALKARREAALGPRPAAPPLPPPAPAEPVLVGSGDRSDGEDDPDGADEADPTVDELAWRLGALRHGHDLLAQMWLIADQRADRLEAELAQLRERVEASREGATMGESRARREAAARLRREAEELERAAERAERAGNPAGAAHAAAAAAHARRAANMIDPAGNGGAPWTG